MRLIAATIAMIASAASDASVVTLPPRSPQLTADTTCAPIRNVDSVLVPGRVTLFGEMHGTEQMPAFVGNVLCHAWKRHIPATLGLELASESSRNLDAFVHSPSDSVSARRALLADSVWHGSFPDGRSSLAMLRLLETVRAFARAGADVRVIAFSRPSFPTRDSTMAVELSRAIAPDPSRTVVVLTGNIHSRVVAGISFNPNLRPMGLLLREFVKPRRVVGLDVSYQNGTTWLCTSADASTCGVHTLKGNDLIPAGGIELAPRDRAYDGVYSVGPISAAMPAVAQPSEPRPRSPF